MITDSFFKEDDINIKDLVLEDLERKPELLFDSEKDITKLTKLTKLSTHAKK